MKRTERLFAIAEHLRTRRRGVTAELLAERFNVSVRTMYRDLDALRAAHLPLNSEAGPGGGYALDKAYELPPVNFSVREATLLVWAAECIQRQRILPFFDTLNDAAAKVRSALPAAHQVAVDRRTEDVSFVGVPGLAAPEAVRRAIEEAWVADAPLRIVYQSAGGRVSTRCVRVRNVVVDRRETRLNCDDLEKGEPRQFLLHRVTEAAPVAASGA